MEKEEEEDEEEEEKEEKDLLTAQVPTGSLMTKCI